MSEDTIILFISSWRTTNKLQLVLINVLIRLFINNKVLQGSVSTHLRSDGISNSQFITQWLLSPRVKIFRKSVNICRSYGQLSRGGVVFLWNTVCTTFQTLRNIGADVLYGAAPIVINRIKTAAFRGAGEKISNKIAYSSFITRVGFGQ